MLKMSTASSGGRLTKSKASSVSCIGKIASSGRKAEKRGSWMGVYRRLVSQGHFAEQDVTRTLMCAHGVLGNRSV